MALALAILLGILLEGPDTGGQAATRLSSPKSSPTKPSERGASERLAAERPNHPIVVTGVVLSPDGKPFSGARVEIIAYDRTFAYGRLRSKDEPTEYEHRETKSGAHGEFRFELARNASQPPPSIALLASAEHYSPATGISFQLYKLNFELKLHQPKTLRMQFIDAAGNVVRGIEPGVARAVLEGRERWGATGSLNKSTAWPRCSRTDNEGYATLTVPASAKDLFIAVRDEHGGATFVRTLADQKTMSVVMKKSRSVVGKVIAAESGKPLAGAEIRVGRGHWVRADAEGAFRIADASSVAMERRNREFMIEVKPPSDSDYLPRTVDVAWPDEFGDAEVSVALKRGVIVEGRVLEQVSGQGTQDATVLYVPQENNPRLKDFPGSEFLGRFFRYGTDSEGRFRVPVVPGPGYFLVDGPSLDYVHTQFTRGEQLSGKPGLDREYYDAVAKIEVKPGERPQPLTIALKRGVTLRRKVVCPDGAPATGIAFTRWYVEFGSSIGNAMPAVVVDDGLLEVPGFDPKQTDPIFIIDFDHHCGAVVAPKASEIGTESPPIRLQPCGTAKVRFLNRARKPLAGFRPDVELTVTPGPHRLGRREANPPLSGERVFWVNVYWRAGVSDPGRVSDAEGRMTLRNLIPGAPYELKSDRRPRTSAREFSVHPGETLDFGDVVIDTQ
jgi:hypothetical protein